jgi:hypothetical protein
VATCMLREMALRRALSTGMEGLPPMEGYVHFDDDTRRA